MKKFLSIKQNVIKSFTCDDPSSTDFINDVELYLDDLDRFLCERKIEYSYKIGQEWIEHMKQTRGESCSAVCKCITVKVDSLYIAEEVTKIEEEGIQDKNLSPSIYDLFYTFRNYKEEKLSANSLCVMPAITFFGKMTAYIMQIYFCMKFMSDITYGILLSFASMVGIVYSGYRAKSYFAFLRQFLEYTSSLGILSESYNHILHYFILYGNFKWLYTSTIVLDSIVQHQYDSDLIYFDQYTKFADKMVETHKEHNYSKSRRWEITNFLRLSIIYLKFNDLNYSRMSIEAWFNDRAPSLKKDSSICFRITSLIDQYQEEESIKLSTSYRKNKKINNIPSWCETVVRRYIEYKESEGWAKSTIDMITASVCRFCFYLDSVGIRSFREIDVKTIKDFNLADQHSTPAGKNAYNSRIKKFLEYLVENKYTVDSPLYVALKSVSAPKETLVVTLTNEELTEINSVLKPDSKQISLRQKAVLLLGLKMGIRESDIVNLMYDNIDWESVTISFMQTKTQCELRLPMPIDVANAIYRYITQERPKTDSKNIFIKSRAPYQEIKRNTCNVSLKKALPNREVKGSGFHVTRKTFATSMLRNGVNVEMTSRLLGHKGTDTVHRYLSLDDERMKMCSLSLESQGILFEGDFE